MSKQTPETDKYILIGKYTLEHMHKVRNNLSAVMMTIDTLKELAQEKNCYDDKLGALLNASKRSLAEMNVVLNEIKDIFNKD